MFLETKKEGEIQQAAPSLAGFVAWLETKNPRRQYNYWNYDGRCLVGQYVNAIGLKWNKNGGPGEDFSSNTDAGEELNIITNKYPHSFGAALKRARVALSKA